MTTVAEIQTSQAYQRLPGLVRHPEELPVIMDQGNRRQQVPPVIIKELI